MKKASGPWEVEQKFPLTAQEIVRSTLPEPAQPAWPVNPQTAAEISLQLAKLGAVWSQPLVQVDIYFAHPSKNFRQTDEALRLRRVGSDNVITYKGPKLDKTTKTREEIELPIASGEEGLSQFQTLLERLGFVAVSEVHKVRVPGILNWNDCEIHLALDSVQGLGDFLELEMMASKDSLARAKQQIDHLAAQLSLTQTERRGYLDLLLSSS